MARRTGRRERRPRAGGPPLEELSEHAHGRRTHPPPLAPSAAACPDRLLTPGRTPIAVLASGVGTNLRALLDASARADFPAEVTLVVTNRPSAGAMEVAASQGIESLALPASMFDGDRGRRDAALRDHLVASGARLVVLAGYDQLLGDVVLDAFPGALINLHPSLLPAFAGGMHAIEDALAYGAKVTGATVHFVDRGAADGGAVILQRPVEIRDDDTADTLRQRVHEAEWELLPTAVDLWCSGRLRRDGRRVTVNVEGAP